MLLPEFALVARVRQALLQFPFDLFVVLILFFLVEIIGKYPQNVAVRYDSATHGQHQRKHLNRHKRLRQRRWICHERQHLLKRNNAEKNVENGINSSDFGRLYWSQGLYRL